MACQDAVTFLASGVKRSPIMNLFAASDAHIAAQMTAIATNFSLVGARFRNTEGP